MDNYSNPKRARSDILPDEPPPKRPKPVNDSADRQDIDRNHPNQDWSPRAVDPLQLDELEWLDLAVTSGAASTCRDRYPRSDVHLARSTLITPWPRDDSFIGCSFTKAPSVVPTALHAQVSLHQQIKAANTLMQQRIRIQRFVVAKGMAPPIRIGSHVPGSSNLGRIVVGVKRRLGRAEDSKRVLEKLLFGDGS